MNPEPYLVDILDAALPEGLRLECKRQGLDISLDRQPDLNYARRALKGDGPTGNNLLRLHPAVAEDRDLFPFEVTQPGGDRGNDFAGNTAAGVRCIRGGVDILAIFVLQLER